MPEDRNVLGEELGKCSIRTMSGFYRTGCCETGPDDIGAHVVCAEVKEELLSGRRAGNRSRAQSDRIHAGRGPRNCAISAGFAHSLLPICAERPEIGIKCTGRGLGRRSGTRFRPSDYQKVDGGNARLGGARPGWKQSACKRSHVSGSSAARVASRCGGSPSPGRSGL
jgi:uncharacterized protein (DUF2237 family)